MAIWHTRLAPYIAGRVRAYARLQPDVVAVELASTQERYGFWPTGETPDGFRALTLFQQPFETVSDREQALEAERCLVETNPAAVVVAGYVEPVMRGVAAWAQRRNRPVVMMADSTRVDHPRWPWREWAKRLVIRRLYDCAFVAGQRAARYMQQLGFGPDAIWVGYDVVDNEHFRRGADAARASRNGLRGDLDLPEQYFLYVGRFAPEKNLARLLHAYDRYRGRGGTWDLVLVGSGPMQGALSSLAERHGLPGVYWPGAISYDELPTYYGLASCLVLPSTSEPWGLVVNEAEAAGLPVLVSRNCGCVPELVRRGVNGYSFDPRDVEELAALMLRLSGGEVDLQALGEASCRIVSAHTPETWARALADCIGTLRERKR